MNKPIIRKISNLKYTLGGEARGFVNFVGLKTLWFNTGTICNLTCENCYIESSPKNDRLSFLTLKDVSLFLDEISLEKFPVKRIGFTGGEPFVNPQMLKILERTLERGFSVLILTNAYKVLERKQASLSILNSKFVNQLQIRVSLDHHTKQIHEKERGKGTFVKTLDSIKWLFEQNFNLSLAGRTLVHESFEEGLKGYQKLLKERQIDLKLNSKNLVIFPEMDMKRDVPEVTTACWNILGVRPEDQMCASERMVIKRKEEKKPCVVACTLIPYEKQFTLGNSLKESFRDVYLNHHFCASFCVLGGSSCSST